VLTGQKCVFSVGLYVHATGVVADPPIRASAADEATMYAAPPQLVPVASTAVAATAVPFVPILRTGLYAEAVMVLAAFSY